MTFNVATLKLPYIKAGSKVIRSPELIWKSTTNQFGRKLVPHNYPYKDTVYAEDLGALGKTFTVELIVDYNIRFNAKQDFEAIINSNETLSYQDPFYRKAIEVKATCSGFVNDTELGIATYTVNMVETSFQPFPEQKITQNKFIKSFFSAIQASQEKFNETFNTVETKVNNVSTTLQDIQSGIATQTNNITSIALTMERVSGLANGIPDTINDFANSINTLKTSAGNLVRAPSTLSETLTGAFENLYNAFTDPLDLFNVSQGLTDFTIDTGVENNSQAKKQEKQNANAIESVVKVLSLQLMYIGAITRTYANTTELSKVIDKLEIAYHNLPIELDRDLLLLLQQTRIDANDIFVNLNISLPRLVDINLNSNYSSTILAYELYGDLSQIETIYHLNDNTDASRIQGNITILTNV